MKVTIYSSKIDITPNVRQRVQELVDVFDKIVKPLLSTGEVIQARLDVHRSAHHRKGDVVTVALHIGRWQTKSVSGDMFTALREAIKEMRRVIKDGNEKKRAIAKKGGTKLKLLTNQEKKNNRR